jgi:hypothetical protein
VLGMSAQAAGIALIAKANAGIPQFVGAEIRYSGTPELMADYAQLAAAAGARIVGGCCGTGTEHLGAMHDALAHYTAEARPDEATVTARLGALQAPRAKTAGHGGSADSGRRRRS